MDICNAAAVFQQNKTANVKSVSEEWVFFVGDLLS